MSLCYIIMKVNVIFLYKYKNYRNIEKYKKSVFHLVFSDICLIKFDLLILFNLDKLSWTSWLYFDLDNNN